MAPRLHQRSSSPQGLFPPPRKDINLPTTSRRYCAYQPTFHQINYLAARKDLQPEDGITEFPAIAMDGPGFSKCYRCCGCVTCDCGSCTPSCLFSRISAEPLSFSIYEIFQCPTWNTKLEISVTINNITTVHYIDHGIPLQLENNMSLIITGFSTPPSPIHGALFLRRINLDGPSGISYSLSQPAEAGRPLKGTLSEVQCSTAEDATDFNCIFDEDVCNCFPQGTVLKCDCLVLDIEEIMIRNAINNTAVEGSFILQHEDNKVKTRTTSSGLLSMQLQLTNYTIHRVVKEDNCEIKKAEVTGCHSCSTGGQIMVFCKSTTFPHIISTIECSSFTSFANCSVHGETSTLQIFSNQINIAENCSSYCGPKKFFFTVNGTLSTVATFNKSLSQKFVRVQELLSSNTIWSDIMEYCSSIWNQITDYIGSIMEHWLLSIVITIICILLLIRCCRFCFCCRYFRRREYRRYYRRKFRI
ncbi:hypothetical protein CRE_20973 [Caenorhabditis remanei]|uniref:Phlebovirus glycoprotein G2 fusion domain-containing protein n=1 Tax=Caenorhabditis remanei TaxID=31234 RepID=E3NFQ7_CAERE|nr:hypothetical protein CRE_20973 [Caenorhabditis remanei]